MPRLKSFASSMLRSTAAPRAAVGRQQCRFLTASRMAADKPTSSTSKTPLLPPNVTPEAPSTPEKSQRAADLAAAEAVTESDSAQPPRPKPALSSTHPRRSRDTKLGIPTSTYTSSRTWKRPSEPLETNASLMDPSALPPPTYSVSRSLNGNLPIYTDFKRGGNLKLTTVRKITGDSASLKEELKAFLNKKPQDIKVNSLNGHVVVKGFHSTDIAKFLLARGM